MSLTKNILLALALVISPMLALAHPGHDHSSAWSILIHLAWLAPLVLAGALIFNKRKNTTPNKQGDK